MSTARLTAAIFGIGLFGLLVLEGAIHSREWLVSGARQHARIPESMPLESRRQLGSAPNGHTPAGHQGLIHGTKGDNVLRGADAGERIDALAGRDQIIAGGGDDVLIGGADNDLLMGGPGNDTYIIDHHGGGADVIMEERGTDTLQLVGGRLPLSSIEFLRHGDDLLIRWNHDQPADAVLVRSWFAGESYHVERLLMPDGEVVALEPLADLGRPATLEDLVHFAPAK